ncbi:MAG: serine/threonine-protein phosphatase [Pseudomonadota bacterium]|nr:serine/threonine-protein phosphatase [Pseudomonadota bacterium]
MELKISVLSKPGGQTINQDAFGVWSNASACFCVISDGAGGHPGGEVASKLAVEQVLGWFYQTPALGADALAAALKSANDAIVNEQRRSPQISHMRATVLVLVVDTVQAVARWGHIGDTRLYCFRDQRIVVQTRDHSVVQSMVEAGYLEPRHLRAAPSRNALLAALGDADSFAPSIEKTAFPIRDGDIFLLCTDGLWEHIDEADMEHLLASAQSPEAWLRELETHVIGNGRADQDNYSALVISCTAPDENTLVPFSPLNPE